MLIETLDPESLCNLRAHALLAADRGGFEVCGVLIREETGVISMKLLKNLASAPAQWEIERSWLRDIRKELKLEKRRLVGTFHSHVGGYAYPGEKDLDWYPSGFLMMIYDTIDERVGMWKPLIRKGIGKLRPVAVKCENLWDAEEAVAYAKTLQQKLRIKAKRHTGP